MQTAVPTYDSFRASDPYMSNVTEMATPARIRMQLQLVANEHRLLLQADEERLRRAIVEYEQSCGKYGMSFAGAVESCGHTAGCWAA